MTYPRAMYFRTPEEHHKALLDTAIRAVEQAQAACKLSEADEEDLAFIEIRLRNMRKAIP